jgi:hypothetical protein
MTILRSAICVLVFFNLNLLAQQSTLARKPTRIVKNVQAESMDVEIVGPIDAAMDTPVTATSVEPEDTTYGNLRPPTSRSSTRQTGIARAGESAVAAVNKLKLPSTESGGTMPRTESFGVGESLFPLLPGVRSQAPTTQWEASQNGGQDPQVAVGHSLVAVLTWDTLTFYEKNGTPLPPLDDPAQLKNAFINPTSTEILFAKLVQILDQNLKLNSKVENDPSFRFSPDGEIGDARVIFDNFRDRWVVLATAKNNHPKTSDVSLIASQRRTKFLLAVSLDEDPRHGFRTFGLNATPDDGACAKNSDDSPCPGSRFTPGNAADYPSIGVSKTHYILTIGVGHAPLDGSDHTPLASFMVVLNADDLAHAHPSIRKHAFAGLDLGEGDRAVGVSMPIVMNNDLPGFVASGWGMVANTASDHFIVTEVSPQDPPEFIVLDYDMPDIESAPDWPQKHNSKKLVQYGNVGNQPITATVQGTTLTAGFVDCRWWTDSQQDCAPSVHLVTFELQSFPIPTILKDRVVGWRSQLDDDKDDVVAYGLPGIASNKDGDIAVVYGRSSPKMFMEARFSTWLHNALDFLPSRELHKGEAPLGADCTAPCKPVHPDTAGVSVDPFDQQGIWIGQSFADASAKSKVEVGKVFGDRHPDLWVYSGTLTAPTTPLKAGGIIAVNFLMLNVGDGAAQDARAEMLLVADDGKKTSLGETPSSKLDAGHTLSNNLVGKIPSSLSKGAYKVEIRARLKSGEKQYSEDNDVLSVGTVHVK